MILNAIINDKYLLYSNDDITYACEFRDNQFFPVDNFNVIIDVIKAIKYEKQKFINLGFIDNKKVIMDLKTEIKYYYELDGKYKEQKCEKPLFITKLVNNMKVTLFSEPTNTLSKKYIEYTSSVPSCDGFMTLPLLYDIIKNLIEDEMKLKENDDYKNVEYIEEKTYLKLILEIIDPSIFLRAFNENNDKLILSELNKYLSVEECYLVLGLNNTELIEKLFFNVNNFTIKKDLICMSLINSLHNNLEVEKYYFEEDLISEYAYVRKGSKLVILHDQNRLV